VDGSHFDGCWQRSRAFLSLGGNGVRKGSAKDLKQRWNERKDRKSACEEKDPSDRKGGHAPSKMVLLFSPQQKVCPQRTYSPIWGGSKGVLRIVEANGQY